VKEHQFFHARPERQRHGIIHTTVPPTPVPFIFGAVVLRIQNQHVGIANKIKHIAVIAAPAHFRVREKNNDALRSKQPVTHRDAGMVGALGADEKAADGKIEIGQLLDVNVAGELRKRNRKISTFHLARERGDDAFSRALTTEDAQPATGFINRRKKWQPLNMIPVRVREQQGKIERAPFEFHKQRPTELAQSRAGIQDNNLAAATDFHASGVATITHRARPRRGNRAANTPEFDVRGGFDE